MSDQHKSARMDNTLIAFHSPAFSFNEISPSSGLTFVNVSNSSGLSPSLTGAFIAGGTQVPLAMASSIIRRVRRLTMMDRPTMAAEMPKRRSRVAKAVVSVVPNST